MLRLPIPIVVGVGIGILSAGSIFTRFLVKSNGRAVHIKFLVSKTPVVPFDTDTDTDPDSEPTRGETNDHYPQLSPNGSVLRHGGMIGFGGRCLGIPRGLTKPRRIWDTDRSMPLEKLTRARMIEALNLLGELAEQEEVTLELCLYGGSAMMLAYSARDTTKDVDVMAKPADVAMRLARAVAQRLNLDESWMNNEVRQFVSDQGTFAPLEIQELESAAKRRLKITRASASYLLAMKCLAGRSGLPGYLGDIGDIRFLIRKMGIGTVDQVEEHLERFYPREVLPPRLRETIEGLLTEKGEQNE